MKLGLYVLSLLALASCTSAPKQAWVPPQVRDVAQAPADRNAKRDANKTLVQKIVGKWVVDQSRCSAQTNEDQRVYISISEGFDTRLIYVRPYFLNTEGLEDDGGKLLSASIPFGRGETKHSGGYGGTDRWETKITSDSLQSTRAIKQSRNGEAPKDYFKTETVIQVLAADRLGYSFRNEDSKSALKCELVRPNSSEAYYKSLRKFNDLQLQEIYSLAANFEAEVDQMALEKGKMSYVKAQGSLSENEIREVFNLAMLEHAHSIVIEEIKDSKQASKAIGQSVDKLIAYGRSQVKGGQAKASDYAALTQIKVKLADLLTNLKGKKSYFIDWGAGGDSMGHGIIVVDPNNKQVLYIGNGDYI